MIIRSLHLLKTNLSFLFISLLIGSSILSTDHIFCQQQGGGSIEIPTSDFYRKNYEVARNQFEDLLLRNPSKNDRIKIYVYMGACFFYTNRKDRAREVIRNIVQYDRSLDFNKQFGDYFLEDYANFFKQTWDNLFGALHIETVPSGAYIYLDDVKQEEAGQLILTPFTISNVPIGEHTIEVEKDGYEKREARVNISSRETFSIKLPLDSLVILERGFVSIISNPPYAAIYLDGVLKKGIRTPAVIGVLSTEKHQVRLELEGYEFGSREFYVLSKDTTYLEIDMERPSSSSGVFTGLKVRGFGGIFAGNAIFSDQHIEGSSLQNINEPFTGGILAGGGIILDLFGNLSLGIDFNWIETMDYTDTYRNFVPEVIYPKMTRNLLYEFSSINISSSICYLFSLTDKFKPYVGAGASYISYNFMETDNFSDYNFDIGGGINIEMQQSVSQALINFNTIAGVRFDLFHRLGLFAEANYSFPTNCKITLAGKSVTETIHGVSGTSIITETRPERENTIRLNPIAIKAGIYFSIK